MLLPILRSQFPGTLRRKRFVAEDVNKGGCDDNAVIFDKLPQVPDQS